MRTSRLLVLGAATAMTLAGCAHTAVAKPGTSATASLWRRGTSAEHGAAKVAGVRSSLADRDTAIYFGFDSPLLRDTELAELQRVGELMRQHAQQRVRIEGNCDERGTDEYNIALGEQRAQAAKRYLLRMGIEPVRITTLSYGKERPKYFGHDETAWAKNRRDDFVVSLR
jgi:peptidoglycan-associated lipoprotein